MPHSLEPLLEVIQRAENKSDLRSRLAPQLGEHFAATRSAIFFFNEEQLNPNFPKILKIALSTEHNPIARYISERHAPVHEGLLTSPKAWKIICPRPDHWHVMAGPIINRGQIIGAVGCTRTKAMSGLDRENLVDLSAICLHLSVWLTTIEAVTNLALRPNAEAAKLRQRLTPRELEIFQLVALGHTNGEIGQQLWITENSVKQALKRMFRKLEVSSRAAMVAKLNATRINSDDHYYTESALPPIATSPAAFGNRNSPPVG